MHLPLSSAQAVRLQFLPECGSTNTELVGLAADAWPDFSVLATDNQTAGRGRLDRVWSSPPGQTLAVSVLLRPTLAVDHFGWLPLIAGLAMARSVESVLPAADAPPAADTRLAADPPPEADPHPAAELLRERIDGRNARRTGTAPSSATGAPSPVTIKWPNDVQIGGRKVSGLLAELTPTVDSVVIGAGLNLSIPEAELPTPASTSLTMCGADPHELLDRVLATYLRELKQLYRDFAAHGGDADASGIRTLVAQRCSTLGHHVRVELPAGKSLFGTATDIDECGRLVVSNRADGAVQAVAAGDVTHLRYE